jgi:GST-like protein
MIDLHFWTTPNGYKPLMLLEETGLPYRLIRVDISKGDQFQPDFLAIAPNNRIPAIVDHQPADGGPPLSVFESGAILLYLADKVGQGVPQDPRARVTCIEWLFWQMAGLGPMAGQNHHFSTYAPEKLPYAIDRYVRETARLYAVLNKRLQTGAWICGDDYSIADIACYPWIVPHERQQQDLKDFPALARWFEAIAARPATVRAYAAGKALNSAPTVSEESRQLLFGQSASTVR